jgi:DNA-binding IclR family transcriptional regulator
MRGSSPFQISLAGVFGCCGQTTKKSKRLCPGAAIPRYGIDIHIEECHSILDVLEIVKIVFKYSLMKTETKASRKQKPSQAAEGVAVLHKAFDLLDLLQSSETPQSLDQIVIASKFPRTTVHRILTDMVSRGYVDRNDAVHYSLGEKLLVLGATVRRRLKLRDIVYPQMIKLRDKYGETVNLGQIYRDSILYLEIVESEYPIRATGSLGILDPIQATAIGKAIMAWTPLAKRPVLTNWSRLTSSTIATAEEWNAELERVKRRGYALDDEESMEGGRCIGVALLFRGLPIAGLSISGPKSRLGRERVTEIAEALQDLSSAISERLDLFPDQLGR